METFQLGDQIFLEGPKDKNNSKISQESKDIDYPCFMSSWIYQRLEQRYVSVASQPNIVFTKRSVQSFLIDQCGLSEVLFGLQRWSFTHIVAEKLASHFPKHAPKIEIKVASRKEWHEFYEEGIRPFDLSGEALRNLGLQIFTR